MKNIEELPELMVELIEAVGEAEKGGEKRVFTPRAIEIVKEISEYAQGSGLFKTIKEEAESFWTEDTSPGEIWIFILRKIVGAPFQFHRDAAVLAHMPALEKAIGRETSEGGAAK